MDQGRRKLSVKTALTAQPLIMHSLQTWLRDARKRRRFEQLLAKAIGSASSWHDEAEPTRIATNHLRALRDSGSIPLRKGAPDLTQFKRRSANELSETLAWPHVGEESVSLARLIASVDPRDVAAFELYLSLFWLANRETIALLKGIAAPFIALHMTCLPRLERADASIESFSAIAASTIKHIKLIGGGGATSSDQSDSLLQVPAPDSYEHLPLKITQGLALLALSCPGKSVLKLDDDHRLKSADAVLAMLKRCRAAPRPLQMGQIYRSPFPSGHNRAWHFGKCADATLGQSALEFPTPLAWISGEFGYVLNSRALWRFPWVSLYYRRWLESMIYEDVAIGEICEKLWIDRKQTDMGAGIELASEY